MSTAADIAALHRQILADRFAPASVVVNRRGRVLEESGLTAPFLASGKESADVVGRAHADLRSHLRAALARAAGREEVWARGLEVRHQGRVRNVDLLIAPLAAAGAEDLRVIVFRELEPRRAYVQRLEAELEETRRRLHQSLKDLQLSNEEFRLTNDELQFSQEELQVANQRLLAANTELQSKVESLDRAHADLNNLVSSTDIPKLVLDRELRIKWSAPAARGVFHITGRDVGRPLEALAPRLRGDGLIGAIEAVLGDQVPREVSVRGCGRESAGERRYLARIHPYRTLAGAVDGAVLTLFDVTDRELAAERLRINSRRQAALGELGLFALHSGLRGLLGEAIRVVRRVLGAELCEVLRAQGDRLLLEVAEGRRCGRAGASVEMAGGRGPAARAFAGETPVLFDAGRQAPGDPLPARLEEAGIQSGVACLLRGWDENFGVLGVYSTFPGRFGREEVEFVVAVANIVAAAASRDAAVRRLHESETRHRRQAKELATLYQTAPIGLAVVDREYRMIKLNDWFAQLHRLPREALEGRAIGDVVPALTRTVQPNLERVLEDGAPRLDVEFSAPVREGERPRHWQGSYIPLEDAQGRVEAVSCVIQDVTERVETEEALRDADRHKDEFLALLGHELRNPLSAIVNANQLQKMFEPDDPRLPRMTEAIGRQAFQMKRLIDDLLDVSRIARGKIRIQEETLDLARLVRSTSLDYGGLIDLLELELELPPEPVWVCADPARLSQVLENLLNNAIKFSEPPGRIRVSLDARGGRARLRVRDSGVGIEPELLEGLFEPFRQARPGRGGVSDGLGLGLALVKGITELHGGRVFARSEGPGSGSEFVVEIPLSQEEPSVEEQGEEFPVTGGGLRILLVEDNLDAAELMAELLTSAGHEVVLAHDADEGLRRAREWCPEIILCDLGLPGKSGLDFAREVCAGAAPRPSFLVALTGYGAARDVGAALEAGFDRHLTKPIDWEVLDRILRGGVVQA